MAFLDYGALLKVDDIFINRNEFFMKESNTGYIPTEKTSSEYGSKPIKGNFFVFAGDRHFLIAFYKTGFAVFSEGKCIDVNFLLDDEEDPFPNCQLFSYENLPTVSVELIDKTWYDHYLDIGWESEKECIDFYGEEEGRKEYARAVAISKESIGKIRRTSFKATWEYNDHTYECLFGYALDSSDKYYFELVKKDNPYKLSKVEIEALASFFEN